MNETNWFSLDEGIKPVRDGVYQVMGPEWSDRIMYALWKKGQWHMTSTTAEAAATQITKSILLYERGCKWRGLLSEETVV